MSRKTVSKTMCALAAAMLAFALAACGGSNTSTITFQNDTGVAVEGFFVSPTSEADWGNPLNEARIEADEQLQIDVGALPEGVDTTYDIGAIDENDLVYEVYEVTVAGGDTLALSADGSAAVLVVTGRDGSTTTYEGYTYDYVS